MSNVAFGIGAGIGLTRGIVEYCKRRSHPSEQPPQKNPPRRTANQQQAQAIEEQLAASPPQT